MPNVKRGQNTAYREPGPHLHRAASEAYFVPAGTVWRNEPDEPTSILMLFAPGAPRAAYFEAFAQLADLSDAHRFEWFIGNDNFFLD
jgi:hypothetical protein